MSDFSDFFAEKKEEPEPVGQEYGGSFSCQTCTLVVNKAYYIPKRRKLTWTCPEGHESEIAWNL